MAAKARLPELVAANAPVFFLHPDDHYMPCSVEWFMHHSELRQEVPRSGRGPPTFKTLLPRGQVNAAALAAMQAEHGGGGGALQLDLDDIGRWGYPEDLIDDVPLYVNAKEVVDAHSGKPLALELNYMTFYAHNGPYWVAGRQVGAHDGDWEHCTVRLDADSGRALGLYFHAHRNHDGCWLPADRVPRGRDGSGRPAAYVALHGHGTYPAAGRQLRALLVANDLCSDRGRVWRPRRCVLLPPVPGAAPLPGDDAEPPPGQRRLMRVPSRGSSLPQAPPSKQPLGRRAANQAGSNGSAAPAARTQHRRSTEQSAVDIVSRHMKESSGGTLGADSSHDGSAAAAGMPDSPATEVAASGSGSGDAHRSTQLGGIDGSGVQVTEGPAPWLAYRGRWGTTPSPITQRWFLAAEPPVSRTTFRRILHFLPEAQLKGK